MHTPHPISVLQSFLHFIIPSSALSCQTEHSPQTHPRNAGNPCNLRLHLNHRVTPPTTMEDPSGSGGWRFAQCFGDKGDVDDITEGRLKTAPFLSCSRCATRSAGLCCILSLINVSASQLISYPPSSSIQQETTSPLEIKVAAWSCSNGMKWFVPIPWHRRSLLDSLSLIQCSSALLEKRLRIQILYRVPVA